MSDSKPIAPAATDTDTAPALPRPAVSLVIPAKNEAQNIGWVLERVPDWIHEVIVVDGLSADGTLEIAKRIYPDVIVVRETRPGKGAALRAGFAEARGEYVAMLDADGSMDPSELGRFIDDLDKGFDVVKGSRFLPGGGTADMTPFRHAGNAWLLRLANLMLRRRFTELCYGYIAFRRSSLNRLGLNADGFEIETQIVARAARMGLRISEVPSMEYPRRFGASNLNAVRDGIRVLRTILRDARMADDTARVRESAASEESAG